MTTDAPAVNDQAGIDDAEVLVSRRGNVMLIVMNRPKARNAVNEALCLAVGDALEEADNDPNVRVVVLTGAGDKAFCAGADLKAIARGEGIIPPGREAWGLAGWVGHAISKPTIAAVNGPALGGGTEIVRRIRPPSACPRPSVVWWPERVAHFDWPRRFRPSSRWRCC